MTVTLITEDVEVPDFLYVAFPCEALLPQLLDPSPGTQSLGVQMAPSQPNMVRVLYFCPGRDSLALLPVHRSCPRRYRASSPHAFHKTKVFVTASR